MKVFKEVAFLCVMPSLLFAWLHLGHEGAGNVAAFMVYGLALLSPLALTKPAIEARAKNPPAITGAWPIGAIAIAVLVWHGHFLMGAAYLWLMLANAIAREAVKKLEAA
jgi:hypothetical protein